MASNIRMKPEDMARVLNADKMLLNGVGEICFRRCISTYDKEYLNSLE